MWTKKPGAPSRGFLEDGMEERRPAEGRPGLSHSLLGVRVKASYLALQRELAEPWFTAFAYFCGETPAMGDVELPT